MIANDDTTVHTWPDIPDFDPEKTLLVFPCDSSVTLAQLAKEFEEEAEQDFMPESRARPSRQAQDRQAFTHHK